MMQFVPTFTELKNEPEGIFQELKGQSRIFQTQGIHITHQSGFKLTMA